ncbi:MAG: phosphonatase-like hydrolase [Acidobacteria bacterium]|nr:phosphonatase-like hydrolase [Acidobacteriota bacterium]
MTDVDLVVCDLAGTTIEDTGHVAAAFTAALEACGVAVTREQLVRVRGASKRDAIRALLPAGPNLDRDADQAYRDFCAGLSERFRREGISPVPGATDAFDWLRARGVRVALNTGFDRDITRIILETLGWSAGVVDTVVCGDDVPLGRPAPFMIFRAMERPVVVDVHRVATVGDTALDLQAGHHAGVRWNIGVLSGAHGRATLEAAPHTHLLPSVASLPDVWRESDVG